MSITDSRAQARQADRHAAHRAAVPQAVPTAAFHPAPRIESLPAAQQRLRALVMHALEELKARDISEVDVRGKSSVTDLLVIASGTSSRHVRSIAEEVVAVCKHADLPPLGVEGEAEGEWALVDLGDIVVHVMQPRVREFYGLERLWTVGDQAPDETAEAD